MSGNYTVAKSGPYEAVQIRWYGGPSHEVLRSGGRVAIVDDREAATRIVRLLAADAAAPDLLAALQAISDDEPGAGDPGLYGSTVSGIDCATCERHIALARAAIAKATGAEPDPC